MPLNENAQKWVDALRSGKFKQTRHVLADSEGYCCLGVACQLAVEAGLPIKRHEYSDGTVAFDGYSGPLPPSVREWLGLNTELGRFSDGFCSLVRLNDGGASFDAIAAKIEAQPEGLFEED